MQELRRRGLAESHISACGVWLIRLGFYFMLLRPSLLADDTRFTGGSLVQVRAARPGPEGWLHRVFAVMGGFIAGTGVLTVFIAWVAVPAGFRGTSWVIALTGAMTVALMSVTNFALEFDFRWVLLVPALVWLASLIVHVAREDDTVTIPTGQCASKAPSAERATVVELLRKANTAHAKDGWTNLADAVERIGALHPDQTQKRCGCASWRHVFHESKHFEIRGDKGMDASPGQTWYRVRVPRGEALHPVTPDGRYFVVRGRLWRMANPERSNLNRNKPSSNN